MYKVTKCIQKSFPCLPCSLHECSNPVLFEILRERNHENNHPQYAVVIEAKLNRHPYQVPSPMPRQVSPHVNINCRIDHHLHIKRCLFPVAAAIFLILSPLLLGVEDRNNLVRLELNTFALEDQKPLCFGCFSNHSRIFQSFYRTGYPRATRVFPNNVRINRCRDTDVSC